MSKLTTSAIILAGGEGSRMKADKTKQFIRICGKTVLERTVSAFDNCIEIDEIIVVARNEEMNEVRELLKSSSISKPYKIVAGGSCRAESAARGFSAVSEGFDYVAIHDAARCLLTPEMIGEVVEKAHKFGAATAVCAISDTVKSVDARGLITSTIPRENVYRAQTPQVFAYELYRRALDSAKDLTVITDDNMLAESIGADVCAVDLGYENIKITTQDDLTIARSILAQRGEIEMCDIRVGHGYDVHRLVDGRKLILGGVEIPHEKGLLGHSDADVLLHAVMDSLLGACALGDIGRHFPDTDESLRGISSMHLLTQVGELMKKRGFVVVNVDATLVLQKPKISPYVDKMIANIAFALGIDSDRVNVKATTEEHLGFTGSEEGASAHCISMVSLVR